MSTVAEIEAILPELSAEDLRRVEAALRRLQGKGDADVVPRNPQLRALDALQARLGLDQEKAAAWVATVHDSRT